MIIAYLFTLLLNLFGIVLWPKFWEELFPVSFHLCRFYFSVVLFVCVPFPFGVKGRMWNSVVSVPDHFLFI